MAQAALLSRSSHSLSGGIAPMQQASVSQATSYAARRPGAKLAWIGQGFLVLLALAVVALIAPRAIQAPAFSATSTVKDLSSVDEHAKIGL